MKPTVLLGLVICALCLARPAFADKIVLRNGESLEGTLANREAVLAAPQLQTQFSLLKSDSGELFRFAPEEVNYLVLEGDGDPVVIDLESLSAGLESAGEGADGLQELRAGQEPVVARKTNGKPLIIAGMAMAAVGAFVKFGDEKVTVTSSDIDYDEDSYNALNYALMAGGGILFVSGVVLESSGSGPASQGQEVSRLPGSQPGWSGPTVGLRFRF